MGKTGSILLVFTILSTAAYSQSQPFSSLRPDDTLLKRKYYDQTIVKKNALLARVGKEYAAQYKKIYNDQYKEIGELWQSSRSMTSRVAHDYLQSLVAKVVAANDVLKETDARVVFSRDWWPNAVSMGDGTIAINAGLLVYLDNEAELVFVLCHELAHYHLDHSNRSIRKYVETINSEAYQKELKRLSKEEFRVNQQLEELAKTMVFDTRRHSRENETEADRQAFAFMRNTGYDCRAIITALQLLDKVDDSLLYKPLDVEQALHFPGYPFRKKWIQKESAIFSQLSEEESSLNKKERDSLKTHPDCTRRIAMLADSVSAYPGKKFMVDEKTFHALKKDFMLEITEQTYRTNSLGRNLYYSLLMLQQQEHVQWAVYSVARCLNKIYESQRDHKLGTMIDTENKAYPDDYNLLLRMLSRVRLEEVAALTTHFCNKYKTQMDGNEAFAKEMRKAEQFK